MMLKILMFVVLFGRCIGKEEIKMKKLSKFVMFMSAMAVGALMMKNIDRIVDKKTDKTDKVNKFKGYYQILSRWLALKQEGKQLEQYFVNNDYKTIAIYGMGEMGNRLYEELKDSVKVEIKYAIDKNMKNICSRLSILDLKSDMPKVDVIIVTATFAFYEIERELSKKINYPIVSLEEILLEI